MLVCFKAVLYCTLHGVFLLSSLKIDSIPSENMPKEDTMTMIVLIAGFNSHSYHLGSICIISFFFFFFSDFHLILHCRERERERERGTSDNECFIRFEGKILCDMSRDGIISWNYTIVISSFAIHR